VARHARLVGRARTLLSDGPGAAAPGPSRCCKEFQAAVLALQGGGIPPTKSLHESSIEESNSMQRRHIAGVALAAALSTSAIVAVGAQAGSTGGSDPVRGPYFAVLDGNKEINADTGERGAGDPQGRGAATVLLDVNAHTLCFTISVKNIGKPNAAHIHKGAPGKSGDVVVPLVPPTTGKWGASSGCVTIDAKLLGQIRNNPRGYYVNVHTGEFPNGAVRGNLFSSTES
jgi:hypothetical protein